MSYPRAYTSHQPIQTRSHPSAPIPIPSPPSYRFAQQFPIAGYAPAGVRHPSRHHRSPDPQSYSQYHSPSYSTHYAHNRSHHHVQHAPVPVSVPVPVPPRHSSQSRSRRPSYEDGSRVADFHFNPALAYPSHSHSEPMYTHTKPILRNKGGTPPAPVHTPPRGRRLSFIDGLTRRNPAPTKRVQFRPKASVRTY